ncbi:hypothetical protein [Cohnella sp. REN36]|uniref:hypothetical protein n=1 Tax=Cohnella sp. REN36 TaxID=2887347 RepID=UPI001D14E3BF|nr:hypothetical protein [Cohnella sp. REN36]MCC3375828.1 hypothetical protein [Cohnella sp. REN36]
MHKLLFSVLMIVVWWLLHAMQMDEELAMGTLHEGKRAIDRAAHAAAQQVDRDKLEIGILSIAPGAARSTALDYLQANLRLGPDLEPVPGSWLRERLEVRVFEVINEDVMFPYTYRNLAYDYEVTLDRPGVILIAHLKYPRVFGVLAPVEWDLKGTAELVYT